MDIDELFKFYRREFLPAYSDLVGYIVKKPRQILTEMENTLAHIAQYYNPALGKNENEKNLEKAYDHLMRVTLDCYKLLWVYMNTELEEIYLDEKKRAFTLNVSEEEFIRRYHEFRAKAQEARRIEMTSVGRNPLASIEIYKNALKIGKELMDSIDTNKLQKLKRFRTIVTTKEVVIAFVIGLLTGVMTNIIWSKIMTPP